MSKPRAARSSAGTPAPEHGDTQQQQQQQQQQQLSRNAGVPHSAIRQTGSEGRRRRRKAPSIQPSSNPPLPAVLHAHPAALRRAQRRRSATGAPRWWQGPPPPPHRSRCQAADVALRRHLPAPPKLPPHNPCARVPPSQHAQPSAEPVGGSQLPSPAPSGRGAAAPSSLQMSGEMTVTAFPCFQRASRSINN